MTMKRTDSNIDSADAIAQMFDRLREELVVVREVLDELRDELQWANRNRDHASASPPFRITSMPSDPAAADWAERLNRFSADDVSAKDDACISREPGQLF